MPESRNACFAIKGLQALSHATQHLRGAHRPVINQSSNVVAFEHAWICRYYKIGHQIYDVAASEVFSSLIRLRKPAYQVFEDAAHLNFRKFVRREVGLGGSEVLNHLEEDAVVCHGSYLIVEFHSGLEEDILHIFGEAMKVLDEVFLYAIGVANELCPCESRGVVEVIS